MRKYFERFGAAYMWQTGGLLVSHFLDLGKVITNITHSDWNIIFITQQKLYCPFCVLMN